MRRRENLHKQQSTPCLSKENQRLFPKMSMTEVDEKVRLLAEKVYASAIKQEDNKEALALFTVPEDCPIGLHEDRERAMKKEMAEQLSQESAKKKRGFMLKRSLSLQMPCSVDGPSPLAPMMLPVAAEDESFPDFQRVTISGDYCAGITVEDYEQAASSLLKALFIREKYSRLAYHRFPRTLARFLRTAEDAKWREEDEILPDIWPCPGEGEDPYTTEGIPENLNYQLQMKDGIVNVYDSVEALRQEAPHGLPYPDFETFAIDLSHVLAMIADGPT